MHGSNDAGWPLFDSLVLPTKLRFQASAATQGARRSVYCKTWTPFHAQRKQRVGALLLRGEPAVSVRNSAFIRLVVRDHRPRKTYTCVRRVCISNIYY